MTGLLTTYLGFGALANRPEAPDVAPGTLAIYKDESGGVWAWDQAEDAWTSLVPEPEPFPDLSGFISEAPNDAYLYVRGQKQWVILPPYPNVPVQEAPNDGGQYARKNGGWVAFAIPDNVVLEAPDDAKLYGRKGKAWAEVVIPAAGIPDSAQDGKLYGRKNGAWAEVVIPAAGVPEAPNDAVLYGRKGLAWSAIPAPGIADAPSDGVYYTRRNAGWAAMPAAGIADAPSDGTIYGRQNAAWVAAPSGGGGGGGSVDYQSAIALTPPTAATFTIRKGSAAVTTNVAVTNGRLRVDSTRTSDWTGEAGVGGFVTVPAGTTWEATMLIQLPNLTGTYVFAGIIGRAANGNSRIFGASYVATTSSRQFTWNDVTIPSTVAGWTHNNDSNLTFPAPLDGLVWLRMVRNGGTIRCYFSQDGIVWEEYFNFAMSNVGTFTEVGFGFNPRLIDVGSNPAPNKRRLGMTIFHWSLTTALSPLI